MRRLVIAALALLLVAGGLGIARLVGDRATSAPVSSGAVQGPASRGYLATIPQHYAAFLELTTSGTSLTGTWDSATIQGTTVKPATYSLAGSWDRSGHLTLTLNGSLTYSGDWQDDGLTVSVPQPDGSLWEENFTGSDSSAYNAAVAELQTQAASAAAAQRQEQEQASAAASAAAATAAAQLAATKAHSCAAINGHIDPSGGPMAGWCDSNVSGNPSGSPGSDCANAQLSFNPDGTIWRIALESSKDFYPGCWPSASSVPNSVAH